MSEFHENIRSFIEDVQLFLKVGLKNEVLTASCKSNRDELIAKLNKLGHDYPQLQLCNISSSSLNIPGSSSPQPYLDMHTKNMDFAAQKLPEESHYYDVAAEDEYESVDPDDGLKHQPPSYVESKTVMREAEEEKKTVLVPATDLMDAIKTGYLEKKGKERLGGFFTASQKRWCAVKEGIFYYYDRPTDKRQKGQINLSGYEPRPIVSDQNKDSMTGKACFELVCPGRKTFQFVAVSVKDMKQWLSAIEQSQHTSSVVVNTSTTIESIDLKTDDEELEEEDIYESLENNSSFDLQPMSPLSPIGSLEHDYDEGLSLSGTVDNNDSDDYADAESMLTQVLQISNKYDKANNNKPKVTPQAQNNEDLRQVVYVEGEGHVINPSSWVIGVWDCKGSTPNELTFNRGDLIKVISRDYDDYSWWVGQVGKDIGLIPKNYITPAYVKV